jgi:hypothetical protein
MKSAIPIALAFAASLGLGCGSANPNGGTDSGGEDAACSFDSGSTADSGGNLMDSGPGGSDAGPDAGADAGPQSVTFSYTPAWHGVSAVMVVGGFGQANDWKMPFLTLTKDVAGNFTGTSMLAAGSYLYLFKVTGDVDDRMPDGGTNSKYSRYSLDPSQPLFQACPPGAPTYTTKESNPCSVLDVPQGTPSAMYHLRGQVTFDGGAAPGWLVVLERNEKGSHHMFVNRTDSDSSGNYDLQAAPGVYRFQVQLPTYLFQTDAEHDPFLEQTVRRSISGNMTVGSADIPVAPAEISYHVYGSMQPVDAGVQTLPVTFSYDMLPGATSAYASVYGGGNDAGFFEIGDPWWSGHATSTATGSTTFDGGFAGAAATQTNAIPGEPYLWGAWQSTPADGGVTWTEQSMVFPIVFN